VKKLLLFLFKHKKKVFFSSFFILFITIVNLIQEVVIEGQGLFAVPEEVLGWVLGFTVGTLGILFYTNNKKELNSTFNIKLSSFFKKIKTNIIISNISPYFFYNGSYISGSRYWLRKLLQWTLIFLVIGFYLRGVTTYARSRSLNLSILGSIIFSVYSFLIDIYIIIIIPINDKLIGVIDDFLWIYITPVLPLAYLLFADGKEKINTLKP
tara:strand:+ start:66 stop:695 length:630 start_codon:yes stop_codon:yes gene_type:complete